MQLPKSIKNSIQSTSIVHIKGKRPNHPSFQKTLTKSKNNFGPVDMTKLVRIVHKIKIIRKILNLKRSLF